MQTTQERIEEMRAALVSPLLSHTRYKPYFGGIVTIYHRDASSPTGVRSAAGGYASEFDPLFDELSAAGLVPRSASPLSPTEGL